MGEVPLYSTKDVGGDAAPTNKNAEETRHRSTEQLAIDRGTSPIRNSAPLGPYSRTMPGAPWKPQGGRLFLMSEVPLHPSRYNALQEITDQGPSNHYMKPSPVNPPRYDRLSSLSLTETHSPKQTGLYQYDRKTGRFVPR